MSQFHTRTDIGLRAPRSVSRNITPQGITVHYGGPAIGGFPWDHDRCHSIWRAWQAYHMDRKGWADIAYTSGVCLHGHRFEGRGKGVRTAAQGTNDGNQRSYGICGIWGKGEPLTDEAKLGFLAEQDRLGVPLRWVHREWHSTECPGSSLVTWQTMKWVSPGGSPAPVTPPQTWKWSKYVPQPLDRTSAAACPSGGYWEQSAEGGIYAEGGAPHLGAYNGLPAEHRNADRLFVALIATPQGGYIQIAHTGENYRWDPK